MTFQRNNFTLERKPLVFVILSDTVNVQPINNLKFTRRILL